MGRPRASRRHGAIVYWETHRHRIIGGLGSDFITIFDSDFAHPSGIQVPGGSAADPVGWTTTVVEVGAGTSEATLLDVAQGKLQIVSAGNENDGLQMQLFGETLQPRNGCDYYLGAKIDGNDVDQVDLLFGACITDTTLLGGMTDGIYFETLDASAALAAVTEKDSTETTTAAVGTLVDDTQATIEIYIREDDSVFFYVDGELVATHTANIPADELLRLSIAFLTGEAAANNVKFDWLRAYQIGRP